VVVSPSSASCTVTSTIALVSKRYSRTDSWSEAKFARAVTCSAFGYLQAVAASEMVWRPQRGATKRTGFCRSPEARAERPKHERVGRGRHSRPAGH
jgi:hypothetical protein